MTINRIAKPPIFDPSSIAKMSKCCLHSLTMLPESSGIYFITDYAQRVYYIGKASNLRDRLSRHERMPDFRSCAQFVSYHSWPIIEDIDSMEYDAIGLFNPPLNSNLLQSKLPLVDIGLTEAETLDRYAYLQAQKKLIDKELDIYKPNLITIIEKNGGKISGLGYSGYLREAPVWEYSSELQQKEKDLKRLKEKEREDGIATFENISICPIIRISQTGIGENLALSIRSRNSNKLAESKLTALIPSGVQQQLAESVM